MQFSVINYSHHAVHYTPMSYFYIIGNLSLLTTFTHSPHPNLTLTTNNLFSVSMSSGWLLCLFLDSTSK